MSGIIKANQPKGELRMKIERLKIERPKNITTAEYHRHVAGIIRKLICSRQMPSGKPMTESQLRRARRRLSELEGYIARGE